MLTYELYVLWSASIYALVQVVKATAKTNGFDTHPFYVRALPLIPACIGAVSGLLIGPELFGWTLAGGAFFGIGAAGVAALSHSVHRQTIRGQDERLHRAKEVPDE